MVNRQKKALGWVGAITQGSRMLTGKKLGRAINEKAVGAVNAAPASYKKGGKVKRTGRAIVHKNEVVLPVGAVKMLKRLMK
jgi:hypothetical protein